MATPLVFWIGFNLAIAFLIVIDLVLLARLQRAPTLLQSILATLVWVLLALGFGLWLTSQVGSKKGVEFFTGYLIEYSLSVDNLFLFALIFSNFRIEPAQQRRILLWGIIGALVLRGVLIGAGIALLHTFAWLIYLFGGYILYAGVHMLFHRSDIDVEKMPVVRFARRYLPLSSAPHAGRFLVCENGRRKFTLLLLVLVVVEATDLLFALDSVPAVFGVTRDPFIVYTSNVCAILGLRSLYAVLARAVKGLVYLHLGLASILIFIGAKMLVEDFCPISTETSLLVIGSVLTLAISASLLKSARK